MDKLTSEQTVELVNRPLHLGLGEPSLADAMAAIKAACGIFKHPNRDNVTWVGFSGDRTQALRRADDVAAGRRVPRRPRVRECAAAAARRRLARH